MDETTLIKVEEKYFNHSYSGDASAASSASGSPRTLLHQPEEDPLKIETTADRVVKINQEQPREENPVLSHKQTTIPSHSLESRDQSEYRCELCIADGKKSKLYANKRSLRRHMTEFHCSTPRFKCEVCNKQFNRSSSFESHSRLHLHQSSGSRVQDVIEYQCEQCLSSGKKSKLFANKSALSRHMTEFHCSTRRFKCEVCSKQFNNSSNFKRHTRAHLNQTLSFKCKECMKTFTTKAGLNLHLVSKHNYNSTELNVKVFPCDLCSHVSFGKSLYERHVVETHVVDKPLECHVCSKTVMDQDALSKHLKKHDTPLRYACDMCSKTYANKTNFLDHLWIAHYKLFRCGKCKKSFSNKSEFDTHLELLSQNEFSCQICSQPFRSQCSLSLHIECHNLTEPRNQDSDLKGKKIKHNSDEFKCEICLKTFDREAYIVSHRTLVHPNSQWPCSKCSRTFKMRSQMKTHELTHQENKPHACKFCDKSYCTAHYLKVHENNTHSIRKHFKCQQCPESFASSFSLKLHVGNFHGGEKPYKCHLCSTSCVTAGYLKRHLISHRTERLFPCESCPKSFKYLQQLKRHVRVNHVKRAAKKKTKVGRLAQLARESLVFMCNMCSFETQEDKEVATHYNSHGLPKIILFRQPLSLVSVKHNSRETTPLRGNINVVRSIEKRYKNAPPAQNV